MLNNFRNIVVSKFYNTGGISAHTLRSGLFLCPYASITICGCLHRLIVIMAIRSTCIGLRQRVTRTAVFLFLHASLKTIQNEKIKRKAGHELANC